MASIEEVDEALRYTSLVPLDARGEGWHAWVDALLEQRAQLAPEKMGGDTQSTISKPRRVRALPTKERK
jgi:hypothetical protein